MKTLIISCFFALLAMILLPSCDKDKDEVKAGPVEIKLTQHQMELLDGANGFGLELFREVLVDAEIDENVFISPLSAHLALTMTWNGAEDNTRKEMTDVLRLPGDDAEIVNSSFRKLMDDLLSVDKKVDLLIANSIWYRHTLKVEKDFLDINQKYFDALVKSLDFDDPASLEIINGWVKENTRSKIEKIIEEIYPEHMMYLINAIYFKGIWMKEFVREKTRKLPFYSSPGFAKDVMTMETEGEFGYTMKDGYQVAELLYGRGNYSMLIFLPDENTGIDSIIEKLDPDEWKSLSSPLPTYNVNVRLPRFTFEYELDFDDMLKRMGTLDAFGQANFCRMCCGMFIGQVKHKTFVEVNEEGTEAAAVTAVIMERISNPGPEIINFHVNRPFFFAIREKYTNAIIFIGRVMEP
jgi:serine protease inhibitor